MHQYEGKNAIIFGGSSGIGLATAQLLHQRGAKVTIADIEPPPSGKNTPGWIVCDVRNPDQIDHAITQIADSGRLHWLVYSAGIQRYGSVVTTSIEEYDLVQAVNVRGAFLAARAAISQMRSGGSIVNVSSTQGTACQRGVAAYVASKGALDALTRAMAIDHALENIRINVVLPGTVDTPMVRASAEMMRESSSADEVIGQWGKSHPMGRVAQPEEIAKAIAFLLSDEASFITGGSFVVDGGLLAQLSVKI